MDQLIYIELDCLLDTRITTLASMVSPELAAGLVSSKYRDRVIDDFTDLCGVGKAEFMEEYSKRSKDTLIHSRPTEIIDPLREIVLATEKGAIYAPYAEGANVQVNVYPYELSDAELDAIQSVVMASTGVDCRVEVTYFPPEAFTPQLIKTTYAAVILYDFNSWLEMHQHELLNNKMPTVTFVAPALYKDYIPTTEELDLPDKDVTSAFAAVELALVDTIDLRLQDATFFSLASFD